MKAWREETKKYRVKHRKEFWDYQTQVENKYIEDF